MNGFGKKGGVKEHLASGVGIGVGVSLLITMLLCACTATMIDKQIVSTQWSGGAALVVHLIAAFVGCMIAAKIAGKRRMIVCILTGIVYFLTLMAVSAAIYGGQYEGTLQGLGTTLGASALAGLLGAGSGKQKAKHYKFG